jgi:hypothetical protein
LAFQQLGLELHPLGLGDLLDLGDPLDLGHPLGLGDPLDLGDPLNPPKFHQQSSREVHRGESYQGGCDSFHPEFLYEEIPLYYI